MTNNTDVHTAHLQCSCLMEEVIGISDTEKSLIEAAIAVLSTMQEGSQYKTVFFVFR